MTTQKKSVNLLQAPNLQNDSSRFRNVAKETISTLDLLSRETSAKQLRPLRQDKTYAHTLQVSASLPVFPKMQSIREQPMFKIGTQSTRNNMTITTSQRAQSGVKRNHTYKTGALGGRPMSTISCPANGDAEREPNQAIQQKFLVQRSKVSTNSTHTYKQPLGKVTLPQKVRVGSAKRSLQKPDSRNNFVEPLLVQYQKALLKEQKMVSPFLVTELDHDQTPRNVPSEQTLTSNIQAFPKDLSDRVDSVIFEDDEKVFDPKYSENMSQLKGLLEEQKTVKHFTREMKSANSQRRIKGTSEFLRTQMERAKSPYKSKIMRMMDQVDLEKSSFRHLRTAQDKELLRIESYDPYLGMEDASTLIQKYTDPTTGLCVGLTKWNYANGEAELKPAIVEEYLLKEDLFFVRWMHDIKKTKRVARFNLVFDREAKDVYLNRLMTAHHFRTQAELIATYHAMVDAVKLPVGRIGPGGVNVQLPKPENTDDVKTRISYMILTFNSFAQTVKSRVYKNALVSTERSAHDRYAIKFFDRWKQFDASQKNLIVAIHKDMMKHGFNLNLLSSLFKEVDHDFMRAHKMFNFELDLPYSLEKQSLFGPLLAAEKFIPIPERVDRREKEAITIVPIEKRDFKFTKMLIRLTTTANVSDPSRLKILHLMQNFVLHIQDRRMLALSFEKTTNKEMFFAEHSKELDKTIKTIRDNMFDTEYECTKITQNVKADNFELNKQRREALSHNKQLFVEEKIPEEFWESFTRFLRMLQFNFENAIRVNFSASVEAFANQLRAVIEKVEENLRKPGLLVQILWRSTEERDLLQVEDVDSPVKNVTKWLKKEQIGLLEEDILLLTRDAGLATILKLRQSLNLEVKLLIDSKTRTLKLSPSHKKWSVEMITFLKNSMHQFESLPCFNVEGLTPRESETTVIYQADDNYPNESIERVAVLMRTLFLLPESLLAAVQKYDELFLKTNSIKEFKKKHSKESFTIAQYEEQFAELEAQAQHVSQVLFQDVLDLGPFTVNVGSVKERILTRLSDMKLVISEAVKTKINLSNTNVEEEVNAILNVIKKTDYKNIEEVVEGKAFLKNLPNRLTEVRFLIRSVIDKFNLLERQRYTLQEEEFNSIWCILEKPLDIFDYQGDCAALLDKKAEDFMGELRVMRLDLLAAIEQNYKDFDKIAEVEELTASYFLTVRKCEDLEKNIELHQETAKICNRREGLFNQPKTDFSSLDKLQKVFQPHNQLWNYAKEYFTRKDIWLTGPIGDLDGEQMPTDIQEAYRNLFSLMKRDFKDAPMTSLICDQLKNMYNELRPYLPIVVALKNPNLQSRHFHDIINKLKEGVIIDTDLKQSIRDLEKLGIMEVLESLVEVAEISTKEKQLEVSIAKMRDEWKHVKFEFQPFRDSGSVILVGVQPIWDLLDEHIQKTMLIAASPFVKYFIQEVLYWKNQLVKVQEVLEEWSRCQRGWLYLWPIFNSPDIQAQLPEVAVQFSNVDRNWHVLMAQTQQTPLVLEACAASRMLEVLNQLNHTIDRVQKSLNEYLHQKCKQFPRFFFLSNDDLLQILSQTKDPLRVQDHLNKCFEGIEKLRFDSDLQVLGMCSNMQEFVEFDASVDPFYKLTKADIAQKLVKRQHEQEREGQIKTAIEKEGDKEVRPIESWLLEVENQMRESLRSCVVSSTQDFFKADKREWIFNWPQQVILAIDQILWTQSVETAIFSKTKPALSQLMAAESAKLLELVELIKTPRKNKADLVTLNSLIVMDVHTKDVTEEIVNSGLESVNDFEWQSQMRHYASTQSSGVGAAQRDIFTIRIRMISCERIYGFEYQGNQTRLVITPLTDRCYRTLMGALQLNLGGAPEGPAGTGKTETTKDLAKALSKQCIVFNCSDQLDVTTMAKFFRGLACCGAWACFDEFNRIDLEVLSVIAQLILQIQGQLGLMKQRPFAEFTFEEERIVINSQCAVFITMNPGYAGRSELPDNLKALFRPVAMMVPNYAMIAEISLYSYGFEQARQLSVKITQSLKLASEQLSTQNHYDYGMRAVKSIILAAGALKSDYPAEEESKLVLRAISDCNIPKFINEDIDLFNGIISDLFPSTERQKPDYAALQQKIEQAMQVRNLQRSPEFELKTIQLYETVQVRHGLMLVGGACGGKTEISATLADALGSLSNTTVHIRRMNPKSVSIGKLYGDFEKVSKDWTDGILAKTVKESASDKSEDRHWIMLDGPVDAVWIENLNTVLDDNKKLCLISGEIVKLTPKMTMMFEVEDLQEASPATVSRCGMVYVSPERLGWHVQTDSWVAALPSLFKQNDVGKMYLDLINHLVPPVIEFLFGSENLTLKDELRLKKLRPIVKSSKNWQYRQFLNLFEALLLHDITRKEAEWKYSVELEKKEAQNKIKRSKKDLESVKSKPQQKRETPYYDIFENWQINQIIQVCLMALVWGFGSGLSDEGRSLFSTFVHSLTQPIAKIQVEFAFSKRVDSSAFPEESENLFKVFYNYDLKVWKRWDFEIEKYNIEGIKEDEMKTQKLDLQDSDGGENRFTTEDDLEQVEFANIMVATEDSIRNAFFLKRLLHHGFPILMVGETGTGKTQAAKKFLQVALFKGGWESGEMVLSATTQPHHIQTYVESKLEKHKKGVFGPKNPGNKLLVFIDDLNMPAKEKYGAQPPLEILRQMIDSKGAFNVKSNEWQEYVNVVFLGSMGVPGGGATLPSSRLLRHFNLFNITPYSQENLTRIFSTILENGFATHPESWQKHVKTLTALTINTFKKTSAHLLPLPSKSHYLFNLRHVSEVVQGLLSFSQEAVSKIKNYSAQLLTLKRLWVHECLRVFADRLTNEADKERFVQTCLPFERSTNPKPEVRVFEDATIAFLNLSEVGNVHEILFSNFVEFSPMDSQYKEVTDKEELKKTLHNVIDQYNASKAGDKSKQRLDLLLFDYMVHHLSRVSRILFKPNGNGLLVGLGGNGRKSICKLATFINDSSIFKIELNKNYGGVEWREDLKTLYKGLGIDNKKTVFQFADKDIKEELFIEDVNNILNVGEITQLFNEEDQEEINFEIEKQMKKTKAKLPPFEVFMSRAKRNLRILLLMSPAGESLAVYLRKYPSLVNCTTIDWFLAWPEEALLTVATYYLDGEQALIRDASNNQEEISNNNEFASVPSKLQLNLKNLEVIEESGDDENSNRDIVESLSEASNSQTEEELEPVFKHSSLALILSTTQKIAHVLCHVHLQVNELANQYLAERKKHVYVTPSSYTKIFGLFFSLLRQKTKFIESERQKFEQGISKLDDAKELIDRMQEELENLKPKLEATTKEVLETMEVIATESREVEKVRINVDREAAEVQRKKEVAEGMQAECLDRLKEAQPLFDSAIKSLRTLTVNDFVTLKSFQNPPSGVKLALEACCIMLGIAPVIKKENNVKVKDYWEKSKKLVKDYKKLLDQLENYDKDNIKADTISKIQVYLLDPNFNPDLIRKASEAAEGICKWVIAICKYDIVYKEISPLRANLTIAEAELNEVKSQLAVKQAELNTLQEKLAVLKEQIDGLNLKKMGLVSQRDDAQKKLNRASTLMSSIGTEKDRWIQSKNKLVNDKLSLLGDAILGAVFVTYLSPFEGVFRVKIQRTKWQPLIAAFHIKHTPTFSLKDYLGEENEINSWALNGLPNDQTSVENMLVLQQTKKQMHPLFIDPQGQALKYLQTHLANECLNLLQMKLGQQDAVRLLEIAIPYGFTVICENVGEVTNPLLTSIVRKELVTINGSPWLKFNDNQIEYTDQFSIFMFSNLAHPHFSPEIQQLVKVLNFSVTKSGLEEQLLSLVAKHESRDEEDHREQLIRQNLDFNRQKKDIMDRILSTLRESGSEILETDDFVNQLEESKQITADINQKLNMSRAVEERLEESRKIFKPVARHAARLYFTVMDLPELDPMYEFSMKWFRELFEQGFTNEVKADSDTIDQLSQNPLDQSTTSILSPGMPIPQSRRLTGQSRKDDSKKRRTKEQKLQRVIELKNRFRELLFKNVSQCLFEHHKLLFAFYMALKIFEQDDGSEGIFAEGLKQLEQLNRIEKMNSAFNSLSKGSGNSTKDPREKIVSPTAKNSLQAAAFALKVQDLTPTAAEKKPSYTGTAIPLKRNTIRTASVRSASNAGDHFADKAIMIAQQREEEKLKIQSDLLQYMLTGLVRAHGGDDEDQENPRPDLFSSEQWGLLKKLTNFEAFFQLTEEILKNPRGWEVFMSSERDHVFENIPHPYNQDLPYFAVIPLIRALKPDLTTQAIRKYIRRTLGSYYVTPIIHQLKEVFQSTAADRPMLLILTPGNDPMEQIDKLAKEKGKLAFPVSLGQGMTEKATRLIQQMMKDGRWIVLQNCHLAASFLPVLEQIIETASENCKPKKNDNSREELRDGKIDIKKLLGESKKKKTQTEESTISPDFRMLLTSMSVDYFPQQVLLNSVKLTSEPPKGIKTSMLRTYAMVTSNKGDLELYNSSSKPTKWQPLFLALSFFHAIVRERKRYGSLGWNQVYDFNDSDFRISMKQLNLLVENSQTVPFKALNYLAGECNYGGRVTDDRDRRALNTILLDFLSEKSLQTEPYSFVPEVKDYRVFNAETLSEYVEYIHSLPEEESPQVMGLHENANIIQAMFETSAILESVLKLNQKNNQTLNTSAKSSSESPTAQAKKMVAEILSMIRDPFKIREVEKKYPFTYAESMNSVLLQELARFNGLIEVVKASLRTLDTTLDGKLVMNSEMEMLLTSLLNNQIPDKWRARSYPSKKPLLSYIKDLKARLQMLDTWIQKGTPNIFWISGFFFTQAFLTGVMQNFARSQKLPIDKISFKFEFLAKGERPDQAPKSGCYCEGLFLEGASWNDKEKSLVESEANKIYYEMPIIHFIPTYSADTPKLSSAYECPVYKTSERRGTLSTTGHSTNFVLTLLLPSIEAPTKWIKRSAALLTQLDL